MSRSRVFRKVTDFLNRKPAQIKSLTVAALTMLGAWRGVADDSIIIESRKADGSLNTPVWSEVSGKWGVSKNKSRVDSVFAATGVSIGTTNSPVPAFRVTPTGLQAGTTYRVEVTFSTSSSHVAAPDLVVAVAGEGLAASTVPTNTPAFQGTGANQWNVLGTITPTTNNATLTFTYVSGTLSKESRWYADAIRFSPVPPATAGER